MSKSLTKKTKEAKFQLAFNYLFECALAVLKTICFQQNKQQQKQCHSHKHTENEKGRLRGRHRQAGKKPNIYNPTDYVQNGSFVT